MDQRPEERDDASLGTVLSEARAKRGWSLRKAEEVSGIRNPHISQIENGVIARPSPTVLFALAEAYGLDFGNLMELAGHADAAQQSTLGAALRALHGLSPGRQQEALEFLYRLNESDGEREGRGTFRTHG